MTSHDVVNFLRKILGIKKIGHGGTLDPAAAGVLPVFIGRATKFIEFFEGNDKQYLAELTFGIITTTGDVQGKIIMQKEVTVEESLFKQVIKQFVGSVQQIPPMHSAVHYQGKKLYELARKGISVERQARTIHIYSIDLIYFRHKKALLEISCSKGTYIRTLGEDIGKKLGTGAHLSCLIRTRSGPFLLQNAKTLEEIQEAIEKKELSKILLSVDQCLNYMPVVEIKIENEKFFKGNSFHLGQGIGKENDAGLVRVFSYGRFLGVGLVEINNNEKILRIVKSLI